MAPPRARTALKDAADGRPVATPPPSRAVWALRGDPARGNWAGSTGWGQGTPPPAPLPTSHGASLSPCPPLGPSDPQLSPASPWGRWRPARLSEARSLRGRWSQSLPLPGLAHPVVTGAGVCPGAAPCSGPAGVLASRPRTVPPRPPRPGPPPGGRLQEGWPHHQGVTGPGGDPVLWSREGAVGRWGPAVSVTGPGGSTRRRRVAWLHPMVTRAGAAIWAWLCSQGPAGVASLRSWCQMVGEDTGGWLL